MSSITSRRPPLVWHPEWPALVGWVFAAVLVCLLYSWSHSAALPVLLGLLTLLAGVGGYLSTRHRPRWHFAWQQRQLWTDLLGVSQAWLLMVFCLVPPALAGAAPTGIFPWQQRILYRHLAWLHAVRLHRTGASGPAELTEAVAYLEPAEAEQLRGSDNLPAQLLAHQVAALRQLHHHRSLTDLQLTALLGCLEKAQALTEAIPAPEAPHQRRAWVSWTWPHAALLAGLLVSLLVETGAYSLWLAVPLTGLICWALAIMLPSAFSGKAPTPDFAFDEYPASVCHKIESDLQKMPVLARASLQAST